MSLSGRRSLVVLSITAVLVFLSAVGALGDVRRGDLRGRLKLEVSPLFEGPLGLPPGVDEPEEDDLLGDLVRLLDDMGEPEEGFRALLDPEYFGGVLVIAPDVGLRLRDESVRETGRVLAVVRLFDRQGMKWVDFGLYRGRWRDSEVSFDLHLSDGGRYDLDGADNGRVEVVLALGAGVVEEDDGVALIWSIGGCDVGYGGLWAILLWPCLLLSLRFSLRERRRSRSDTGRFPFAG